MNTIVTKTLAKLKQQFLIREEGGFPEEPLNGESSPDDATTQVDSNADIPDNEQGEFISSPKLAMFATTLLKAYLNKTPGEIPPEFQNVTANNASEVINFIEKALTLDEPSNDIEETLEQI